MRDKLQKDLGEAVHVLRVLRGMTIDDLAESSTLSGVYLRQIEHGERDVGINALGLVAQGLACSPRDLVSDDGRPAVSFIIGNGYAKAPEAVRRAVLFLLAGPEDSPRKDALLALIPEEVSPRSPRPRAHPRPAAKGRPAIEPTKHSRKG